MAEAIMSIICPKRLLAGVRHVGIYRWTIVTSLAMTASLYAQLNPAAALQQRDTRVSRPSIQNAGAIAVSAVAPDGVALLKLSPGSVVGIHVFEEADLDGAYRLDAKGQVYIPFVGGVQLDGLTLYQASVVISERLKNAELIISPHVIVDIVEYNVSNIVILGEVVTPGRYPVLTPHRLIDVLAMSGGQTSLAGDEIIIQRSGHPRQLTEVIHCKRNSNDQNVLSTIINPGDSVLVKKAGVVYVLGAVTRPGGFIMQEDGSLNIAQVLALAYGTSPEAAVGSIRVIRKMPDGTMVQIPIKFKNIRNGQIQPLALEAEDIVFVPSSHVKSAFIETKTVLSSAASATIYTLR